MTLASQNVGSNVQSRVGKKPVVVPPGVEVMLNGAVLTVKGPKGSLERAFPTEVRIEIKDKMVNVVPITKEIRTGKRVQGLVRALIANMVKGVSIGYSNTMDLHGVGYRIEIKEKQLVLSLGFTHQVIYPLPDGISAEMKVVDESGVKRQRLTLGSHDKQLLGQTIAKIRSFRPPEPYKGKGFRIQGERIREKAGKTGAKSS
ncbi:MAG: 50S ribosomal protein L6 [Deltaproteobacteria bacterium]|nr:50S ribosomal protein L6 [Deltaproteobacteria bacterium]